MKRPKKAAADPHQRIVAAAAEVFASRGFEGARIDEIAERAGVNKAMLYYHVGDKERLYSTVLLESIERALSLLRAAAATGGSPSEKLQAILDTFAAFGTSNPAFIPIILREVASGGANLPDEMFARMGAVLRVVSDVLAEGVERGVFRPTDSLLTHVSLVGALMYLLATHPVRQRVARVVGIPGRGPHSRRTWRGTSATSSFTASRRRPSLLPTCRSPASAAEARDDRTAWRRSRRVRRRAGRGLRKGRRGRRRHAISTAASRPSRSTSARGCRAGSSEVLVREGDRVKAGDAARARRPRRDVDRRRARAGRRARGGSARRGPAGGKPRRRRSPPPRPTSPTAARRWRWRRRRPSGSASCSPRRDRGAQRDRDQARTELERARAALEGQRGEARPRPRRIPPQADGGRARGRRARRGRARAVRGGGAGGRDPRARGRRHRAPPRGAGAGRRRRPARDHDGLCRSPVRAHVHPRDATRQGEDGRARRRSPSTRFPAASSPPTSPRSRPRPSSRPRRWRRSASA